MILATQQDVVDRLRRDLTDAELEHVEAVLEEASVIVEAYLARWGIVYEFDIDVPRIVVIVTSRIAARALTANPLIPEYTGTLQAGQFSAQLSEAYSSAVYLSRQDKMLLTGVTGTSMSLRLVSERGYPVVEDDE